MFWAAFIGAVWLDHTRSTKHVFYIFRIKVTVKLYEAVWVSTIRASRSLFDFELMFGHCMSEKLLLVSDLS